jgi:hypothetical protein
VISSEQNHGTPPTHPNTHTTTQHYSVTLANTNSNISNTSEKTSSSTSSTSAPLYSKKSVKKIIDGKFYRTDLYARTLLIIFALN